MSSYIPPSRYDNKTHFNSTEFKSSLTVDDVTTKLNTKLESNTSSYIDSGSFDNINNVGSVNIFFNVTFTSNPIVVCTVVHTTATTANKKFHITSTTTTDFSVVISDPSSNVNWIAIGNV